MSTRSEGFQNALFYTVIGSCSIPARHQRLNSLSSAAARRYASALELSPDRVLRYCFLYEIPFGFVLPIFGMPL